MVGLGGGSSYVAILALVDIPFEQIPFISLICNLFVVGSGSIHYVRAGFFRKKLFLPVILGAFPFAFIGGTIPVSREFFLLCLSICLILVGIRLIIGQQWSKVDGVTREPKFVLGLLIGAFLGTLSGLLGIGGGIFLSPILLLLRWGSPKEVAASASLFVLLNSCSAFLGHLSRHSQDFLFQEYWPLFLAVFIGGQLGSFLGSSKGPQWVIGNLTALLTLFVGCRTLLKVYY